MSIPIPTISDPSALDALLHRVVKQDTLPGVFFAAANINEIIYENQDGQRVYGQEGGDRINEKTGRWSGLHRSTVDYIEG